MVSLPQSSNINANITPFHPQPYNVTLIKPSQLVLNRLTLALIKPHFILNRLTLMFNKTSFCPQPSLFASII